MRRLLALAVLVCLLPFSVACSGSEKPTYLALGDSLAAGTGASDTDGHVALFFSFLGEERDEDLSLRNFAVEGETTESMIAKGQLGVALAELRFRNQDENSKNDVFLITIDIGGNDIGVLAEEGGPCSAPTSAACASAIDETLDTFSSNLTAILRSLRVAAGPEVRILVLDYFNPYSGTGDPLEDAGDATLSLLNDRIDEVATSTNIDAEVVSTFDAFEGRGDELTSIDAQDGDPHPNDAGHRLLADLLIEAYRR